MYSIKINKEDLNNLKSFLLRVQLTGNEVVAYNKITKLIIDAELEALVEIEKAGEDNGS